MRGALNAKPIDLSRVGEWRDRITSFPADFSNVGIDAETRARIHASVDNESGDYCVAGTALIADQALAEDRAAAMPPTAD